MKILITGANGTIGRHLTRALSEQHELRLADVQESDDPRSVCVDVTDLAQIGAAAEGMDAIVHLAIAPGFEGPVEDDQFNQLRFDVNVKGTWNVLEAARRAGVRRVVHTSSIMVVWGYKPPAWVEADAPPKPVGTYAMTKHLGEILCRDMHAQHGLSIACMRIPKPVDIDDPSWKRRVLRPQWIAIPELMRAYECALNTPEIGFEIVTVVGESSQRRWDLSKAERVLGYVPSLRLEELGFNVGDETAPLVVDEPSS